MEFIKLLEERRSIRAFDPEKHVTAEQIQGLTVLHSLNNFIPVTIGNILGGMVFVGIPCYFIYKKKWQKWHEESKNA